MTGAGTHTGAGPTNGVPRRRAAMAVTLALPVLVFGLVAASRAAAPTPQGYSVPRNPAVEAAVGLRVSAAKVVADGGLVQLDYVVLDSEKASRFQADTMHPPKVRDGKHVKNGKLWRAALMKQGHQLRTGQTYYLVFQNPQGTVRPGDTVDIDFGPTTLAAVPVR